MRYLYLFLLMLAGPAAYTQQLGYVPSIPATYKLNAKDRVPAYEYLADTTQAGPTLAKDDQVEIVGRRGTRWAVLRRNNIDYFIRARYVQGLPAPTLAELVIPAGARERPKKLVAVIDSVKLPVDAETRLITYSKVVPMPGASNGELYARAKLWYVGTFNSGKDVLQADEKDAGIVIGRGWSDVYSATFELSRKTKLWYTVKLAVRDGRYKYDITQFVYENYPSQKDLNPPQSPAELIIYKKKASGAWMQKIIYAYKEQLDSKAKELAASIEASMARPAAGGKADW